MSGPIYELPSGWSCVALRPCTLDVTNCFLPDGGATVWLRDHLPNERIEWWKARVPLARDGELAEVEVRNLRLDVQLPVSRFRELLPSLRDQGANLYLLDRPVPNTLTLHRVPEDQQPRILAENGVVARFFLPHSHETATLATPVRETLERWLAETTLRAWLS